MFDWLQNVQQELHESRFAEFIHIGQAVRTLVLLLIVFFGRWIVLSRLRRAEGMSTDMRRRWSSQVRLIAMLFLLLGLMVIWGAELKTFALSVVAIAAAIVIATKELIMCVSGSLLRASGKSFKIGDRVEIGAFRGDVVDQTLLTTSLLEVGPGANIHQHSGRMVILPNSLLLSTPVVNETFADEFALHAFSVPIAPDESWKAAEAALLEAARVECSGFLVEAQRHMEQTVRRQGLEPLSVEPRVTLRLEDPTRISLLVRIAVPVRRKGRIEQAVLRRYLTIREETKNVAEGSD